jgi:hypothetical protein
MVNTTEAQRPAADGWLIEVMPNSGHPVTHWLVVGPYHDSGSDTDRQGVMDAMFDDEEEAHSYSREVAEGWPYDVRIVTYPAVPIG